MNPDEQLYKAALRRLPTGISVVTSRDGDQVHGMTANTVTSVSIDPLLIAVSVARSARAHGFLERSGAYVVNVLAHDQGHVSEAFATLSDEQRWASVTTHAPGGGIPRIDGCTAWLQCRVWASFPGGDHTLYLGQVVDIELGEDRPPLVRWEGRYYGIAQ